MNRAVRYTPKICVSCTRQGLIVPLPSCFPRHFPHRRVMSSSQWASTPRESPTSGFNLIDSSLKIEEETLPTYHPEKYYPVQQGEVLNDRYQILAKLGYGVTSTVWCARDLLYVQLTPFPISSPVSPGYSNAL